MFTKNCPAGKIQCVLYIVLRYIKEEKLQSLSVIYFFLLVFKANLILPVPTQVFSVNLAD